MAIDRPELYILGNHEIVLNELETEALPRLLGAAAVANCAPRLSGHPVQAAAANMAGHIVHGGNREYGLSRAYVHAEEAVVSKLLSEYPDSPLLGLGFRAINEQPDQSMIAPCPCGNCRDVLLEEADHNLLLAAGDQNSAIIARLSTFLFEDFRDTNPDLVLGSSRLEQAFLAAHKAGKRAVSDHLPDFTKDKVYGVALLDEAGAIYPGSLDTTPGYDTITPAVAAIQTFRNRGPSDHSRLTRLAAILIAGNSEVISPSYRDRDALLGLDHLLQARESAFRPTAVFMIGTTSEEVPAKAWITNTQEWIPYAYTGSANRSDSAAASLATAKYDRQRTHL